MTQTIAIAGKGGVGKTTITGLLVNYLAQKQNGLVLAVDADANANLNEVLGMEVEATLGEIREEIERAEDSDVSPIPTGMDKNAYAEMRFTRALSEGDDFDLLVMGRTQGRGCYCFVNGLLTSQLQKYSSQYRYLVVDNEAGLEHLSRGILPKVDTMILVSDCSRRGVQCAARIFELAKDLGHGDAEIKLIINRAPGGVAGEGVLEEVEQSGMTLAGVLPMSDTIFEYDDLGKPSSTIPEDDPYRKALYDILDSFNF